VVGKSPEESEADVGEFDPERCTVMREVQSLSSFQTSGDSLDALKGVTGGEVTDVEVVAEEAEEEKEVEADEEAEEEEEGELEELAYGDELRANRSAMGRYAGRGGTGGTSAFLASLLLLDLKERFSDLRLGIFRGWEVERILDAGEVGEDSLLVLSSLTVGNATLGLSSLAFLRSLAEREVLSFLSLPFLAEPSFEEV
jgi:hypothetical protein